MRIKEKLKPFIGDRAFYAMVISIVVPMIIQNGITNIVNLLDNVMVGQIGTEQMSGVSLANQLIFVFNLCIFGGIGGVGIFTAQFYGSGNQEGIQQTFRIKTYLAAILVVAGLAVFIFFGEPLLKLFLNDNDSTGDVMLTLHSALDYLHIMLIGLVAFALTNVYAGSQRECGETRLPMIAGLVAVFTNLIFNYILIYGKLGAPAMGVKGAAIATVISRYVELAIVMIGGHGNVLRFPWLRGVFRKLSVPGSLLKQVTIRAFPLLLNETLWSSGMTILTQCYSTRGLIAIAALNINSTIVQLFNVIFFALGNSVAIIVGQRLGAGEMEEARDVDRKIIALAEVASVCTSILLAIAAPFFVKIYNTTPDVRQLAVHFMWVCAACAPLNSYCHCSYFTLRSGGKTFITFLFDCGFLWLLSIPLAFCLSRFTSLPILPLYILCQSLELIKCVAAYLLLRSGIWLNNLVADQ